MPSHAHPTIAVTTDVVLLCHQLETLHILLVQRKYPPFAGQWALPGGFVEHDETLVAAAQRELYEETGVSAIAVTQIGAFGDPHRDPRRHVVSIAFLGLSAHMLPLVTSDETPHVAWFPLQQLPHPLAFDHQHIIAHAHTQLEHALNYSPIAFNLLPERVLIRDIMHIYQLITRQIMDAERFRMHILRTGVLHASNEPDYYNVHTRSDTQPFFMPWQDCIAPV